MLCSGSAHDDAGRPRARRRAQGGGNGRGRARRGHDDALRAAPGVGEGAGQQRIVQPLVERALYHCRRLELACAPAAALRHPCSALAARWWLAAAAVAAGAAA